MCLLCMFAMCSGVQTRLWWLHSKFQNINKACSFFFWFLCALHLCWIINIHNKQTNIQFCRKRVLYIISDAHIIWRKINFILFSHYIGNFCVSVSFYKCNTNIFMVKQIGATSRWTTFTQKWILRSNGFMLNDCMQKIKNIYLCICNLHDNPDIPL